MLGAADLPEEFQDPVAYGDRWLWFAVLAIVLVALYYAAVLWWGRRRPEPPAELPAPPVDGASVQRTHLERLDRLADDVHAGRVSAREGHQQLSEVLRSYVETVTPLPARSMTLTELRRRAPRELTDAVALMYPPEFAPGEEGRAADTFDDAFGRARGLVLRWGVPGSAAAAAPAAPPRGGGSWT